MPEGEPRDVVRAAGGVVYRPRDAGVEVGLVHRPRYDDWSLPKGKLEAGEPALVGACREVLEETGLQVVAGRTLGESRYHVVARGREVSKTVQWWALEAVDGAFTATDEVDEFRWLSPERALRLLSSGYDAEPLRLFTQAPGRTSTLILVRHATAGDRRRFRGRDEHRPLDDGGRQQAQALARLLLPYRPSRLLSAPSVRCVDTLRPLGSATGCPVELDPALSAEAFDDDPSRTLDRLRSLVRDGRTAVVCSQGEVLPDVLRELAVNGRCSLPGTPRTPKGSVWALSFDAHGSLVDAALTADPRA